MLKLRTTKEIQTSLHTDETHKIEFRFRYERTFEGMTVKVDAYKILDDGNFELFPGGGSYRKLTGDQLTNLVNAAKSITPENDNPVEYFDSLVASGIKIVITNEELWKNQLEINDFE